MSVTKLALLGGDPIQKTTFRFNNSIGVEEFTAVQKVLQSGELSGFVASPDSAFYGGHKVRELQSLMEDFLGVKNAIAVNSATSGLHAAVYAAKVGPGDEVITSPYTMSATSTAILMCGGTPIFADIEPDTFGLNPASVEACITSQAKLQQLPEYIHLHSQCGFCSALPRQLQIRGRGSNRKLLKSYKFLKVSSLVKHLMEMGMSFRIGWDSRRRND